MAIQTGKIPTLEEATLLLAEAEKRNPGLWVQHSIFVAEAAQAIAAQHPELDPYTAYIVGVLHDIGRREGVTDMRHTLDGYTYLAAAGFDGAARICLTHSFPIQTIYAGSGKWDCTDDELRFMEKLLAETAYDDTDRLIQLCDALALPSGYCLIEKRLVDVAIRHGTNPYTIQKWKAFLQIQKDFEAVLGQSIYALLPGVIENTFGFDSSASRAASGAPKGPSTSEAARKSSSL